MPKTETSYFEELIPETSRIFSGEGSLTNSSTVCSFLYFSGTVSFTFPLTMSKFSLHEIAAKGSVVKDDKPPIKLKTNALIFLFFFIFTFR